ncbi:MAG: S9 family peptidase [Planctomycetes bacterium]|nr:S9 family peptidase [Planctomycetota bacterium]
MLLPRALALTACLLPFLPLPAAHAQDDAARRETPIAEWLLAGPAGLPLPAFHDAAENGCTAAKLLALDLLDVLHLAPAQGASFPGPRGDALVWTRTAALDLPAGAQPAVAWAAARAQNARFTKAKLVVRSCHLLQVFVDGKEVGKKEKVEQRDQGAAEPPAPGEVSAEVALEPGDHLVLVEALFSPGADAPWTVSAQFVQEGAWTAAEIVVHAAARRGPSIGDLLDTEAVSWVSLSPDGELAALGCRCPEVPAEHAATWVEIRSAQSGELLRTSAGLGDLADFAWRPGPAAAPAAFSFVARAGDKATVWCAAAPAGPAEKLLEDVTKLTAYRWTPDGRSLIYTVAEEPKKDERGVRRMRGLADRFPGQRTRNHLHQAFLAGGVRRRLTAGPLDAALQDIHPNSSRLLFSRRYYDLTERPFSRDELFELDLATLEARPLLASAAFDAACYAPDGERILLRGGPTLGLEHAENIPGEYVPNDYDKGLYLLDRAGRVAALAPDFAPSIEEALWSAVDGMIYARAEEGARVALFRCDPVQGGFAALPCGLEVVTGMSLASRAARLAVHGSSAIEPPRVLAIDLAGGAPPRLLHVPGAGTWAGVEPGAVRDWSFTTSGGSVIDGCVHYPPGFDAGRTYPCIVYFYGGTSPVSREFGGRYPRNVWAAHGYVVYVLNPSGATGYGQDFSDRHVNDWGKRTADEIIEGTRAFLDAHPFADRAKVGCIGASYGGFMTMLLLTRTDLFRAAVAHAGISSISSYWGEGYWGHLYSAVATAESYPWNRPDLYVEQSPLFHADRIHTPLLLLHGAADTNVPVGESEQMYTALRLLGREVELLKFEGEDHRILTYPKRQLWMKTILAWFDKQLKGEPEWWDALHQDEQEEKPEK